MFKRVLLLAVLMAVLVVPGAAIDFRDDMQGIPSAFSHYVSGGSDSVTDGVLKTGTVAGSLAKRWNWYVYPTAVDAPFDYTIRFKTDDQYRGRNMMQSHFGLMSSNTNMGYSSLTPIKYQVQGLSEDTWHTVTFRVLENGEVWKIVDGVETLMTSTNTDLDLHPFFGTQLWDYYWHYIYVDYVVIETYNPAPPVGHPCIVSIKDANTNLPLAGAWHLNILSGAGDGMLVDEDCSGNIKLVYLPETSSLSAHWLHIEKEGYDQIPAQVMFDVPYGGREIVVRLTPTAGTATDGKSIVTFTATDIETGSPVSGALVNVEGWGKFTGNEGIAWYDLAENVTYEWIASSPNHYAIGGNFTLGVDDLAIPVSLTRKTSDLPRPPLPNLPNFPVIHPSLDPAGFRMQILNVPVLGGLASPLLDTMDAVAVGLDDIAGPVLDFATAPADSVVEVLSGVGDQLTESVATYTDIAGVLLGAVGKLLAVFPALVVGLVSYNLVLDLVYLLLRGGL